MAEKPKQDLEHAYDIMLQRVYQAFESAGEGAIGLHEAVEHARSEAVREDGLSPEDAEQAGRWVQRDLEHAGKYMGHTGHELRDWLHMDLELIEYSLLDLMSRAADQTKLALFQLQEAARHADELHSGEVTGPGILECVECGEEMHFKKSGHIPPCPRCHATVFRRKPKDK